MDQSEIHRKIDTDKAWGQVHQRLLDDDMIPARNGSAGIYLKPSVSIRFAYAASVMLIITAGILSYFFFFNPYSGGLLTLETGAENNTLVQTLNDGSVVYLADNTIINYPEIFRGEQRKISFSGEAFFDIYPKSEQPFVIETSYAIIEVLGTAFNLKSLENNFELIVEEGLVRVTLKENPDHTEVAGQWEMVTAMNDHIEKSPVVDRTYLSWKMNKMQFRDEKLENIASVISKNYGVNIGFDNDRIGERRLTATFHNNAISTIAEVIALSLGLEYEFSADSSIIFRDKK